MVVRPFDSKKNLFYPEEDDEYILGLEALYLNASGALLYLAQCTSPDIAFSIKLLQDLTLHQLNDIRMTVNMLFVIFMEIRTWIYFIHTNQQKNQILLVIHMQVIFFYPYKVRSQKEYVFTYINTVISW